MIKIKRFLIAPILVVLLCSILIAVPIKSNAQNSIQHVIVIPEENFPQSLIVGNNSAAPYMNQLISQYAFAANYSSINCCYSLSGYLELTDGTYLHCGGIYPDCPQGNVNQRNIADLTTSWKNYDESMPTTCQSSNSQNVGTPGYPLYIRGHNPFIYYSDVWSNQNLCKSKVVAFESTTTGFLYDLSHNSLPSFSFVVPNGCDDGHNLISNCNTFCPTSVDHCSDTSQLNNMDQWLKWLIPQIQSSSSWSSTAILITFDDCGCNTTTYGSLIYSVWISPFAKSGYVSQVPYNHINAVATFENLLGWNNLGTNDSTATPMLDMFNFSSTSQSTSTLTITNSFLQIQTQTVTDHPLPNQTIVYVNVTSTTTVTDHVS